MRKHYRASQRNRNKVCLHCEECGSTNLTTLAVSPRTVYTDSPEKCVGVDIHWIALCKHCHSQGIINERWITPYTIQRDWDKIKGSMKDMTIEDSMNAVDSKTVKKLYDYIQKEVEQSKGDNFV